MTGSYGSGGNSAQIDISRAMTGTLYTSSNAAVASVSADGLVTIVGTGTAVISGSNGPARDQAVFVVESASSPPLPQNVSTSFSVQRGGFRLDRNTGFYVQSVVLTNSSAAPVPGSAFLVLSGLSSGVQLINKSGATAAVVAGSPYITLPLSSDGRTVAPGQSTTLMLQFLNPNRVSIGYTPSVYRSSSAP